MFSYPYKNSLLYMSVLSLFSSSVSIDDRQLLQRGLIVVVLLLALPACGSLSNVGSTVNTTRVRAVDDVAVVSIWTPNRLEAHIGSGNSVSGNASIGSFAEGKEAVEKNRRRAKPDFSAAMKRVHSYAFGDLQAHVPFRFIDEGKVLSSGSYQNFEMKEARSPIAGLVDDPEDLYVAADRYRPIDPEEMRDAKWGELFSAIPSESDAVLTMKVEYRVGKQTAKEANETGGTQRRSRLQLENGDEATAHVQAKVRTEFTDRQGRTVIKVTKSEWSDKPFSFVYGQGWDADDVTRPALEATENALRETHGFLKKKLSK